MTVPAAATRLTAGFRHGRRTRLGGDLDGICHLGRAASLLSSRRAVALYLNRVLLLHYRLVAMEFTGNMLV